MITDAQYAAWLRSERPRQILVEAGCNRHGVEEINYLSRFGYATRADESPATKNYHARLTGGLKFSRKVSIGATDPTVQVQVGTVDIDNTDGGLDDWISPACVWDRRQIVVLHGDPAWGRADFRTIFVGRIGGIQPNGRGGLRLSTFDEMGRLNYPIYEAVLGGTGPDKDALLPVTIGEIFNAPAFLIADGTHTYMAHNGAIHALNEVRDSGAPCGAVPDLATGKFTLTQHPLGQICFDAQGAAPGGVYSPSLAGSVHMLVTTYGDAGQRLTDADIDLVNFAAFDAANPQPLGLFVPDKLNVGDACRQLAGSVEASLFFSRDGKLRLFRLPATLGAPVASYGTGNMDADAPFAVVDVIPARPSVLLGWGRNWTPTKSGLAGGLPESALSILGKEFAEVSAIDSAAAALYRYAERPVREDTLLIVEADAQTEAQRRLAQRVAQRRVVEFTGYSELHERELGDVVRITHPRFGCAAGVDGIVIGLDEDMAANRIKMEVLL